MVAPIIKVKTSPDASRFETGLRDSCARFSLITIFGLKQVLFARKTSVGGALLPYFFQHMHVNFRRTKTGRSNIQASIYSLDGSSSLAVAELTDPYIVLMPIIRNIWRVNPQEVDCFY